MELERVARMARLRLGEEESEAIRERVGEMWGSLGALEALEEEGVPRLGPLPAEDMLREDLPCQDIDPADLLAGMRTYEGYIRGPLL